MKLKPNDAVIIDAVRTPMGRSKAGQFRHVRAEALSTAVIRALINRNPGWQTDQTDDVIWGCVNQTLEQGLNIGRRVSMMAGLPYSVPGQTVNRLCASSMQALHNASAFIRAGFGDVYVVGGVEHMGHIPMDHGIDLDSASDRYYARASNMMGITAEMLARMNAISRVAQDAFACRSHRRASDAQIQGDFRDEIIPVEGHDSRGGLMSCLQDEVIRGDTSGQILSALKPVFDPEGTVTAGSSSALSDGAAALLVMSAAKAKAEGHAVRAVIRATSVSGCEPAVMGYGPVPATQKLLKQAGMKLDDIDCIEINEAFAAQVLSVAKALKINDSLLDEKVNLNGGAIALGHPLGCSGARIIVTLLNILQKQGKATGLATLCVGLGQGMATLIERV